MKFWYLLSLAILTACANTDPEPSTSSTEQHSDVTCNDGLGAVNCNGMTEEDGNFFCYNVCIQHGWSSGYCKHINGNDAFHGVCIGGYPP